MRSKLQDETILKYLMPSDFAVGCRRPTPGNGYLETLVKENVRVIPDEITRIVPDGIELSTGELLQIDTLICATGFNMSFCPQFTLIGRNGEAIHDRWQEKPEAYLSVAVPGFPNYFSKLLDQLTKLDFEGLSGMPAC